MITCPYCGKAKMETKIIPDLETMFGGVMIRVPGGKISQCPKCGRKAYYAEELKRWRDIKNALKKCASRELIMKIVERKVFENFNHCNDRRAWETACEEQPNDSFRKFNVDVAYDDPDLEHLRQWLLNNGATEVDEVVFLSICW